MKKTEDEHMYAAALKYHVSSEEIDMEMTEINAAVIDMSKFSVLYDRYYIRIFRFVFMRIPDEDKTADVTSRVFLRAMLNLKNYRHKGFPFASWLYRIARNEINQEFRKDNSDRVFQAQFHDFAELTSEMPETEDDQLQKKLLAVLQKLKKTEMELIEMRFFEKRSFKEIGEILDVSENNAKVKMFRVIQRLKKLMNVNS
jgi:RNA polymerase sigma-70 factor, ECF subfamily